MKAGTGLPLYWRVCLINGVVFLLGTVALALSPATVSARVLVSEAIVLVFGLAIIVTLNSLLLRNSLAPLDKLIRMMEKVDLQHPGQRIPEHDNGAVGHLVKSFNEMLTRLETERRMSNAKALAAQEAERHRIAQELHDEIGQSFTAVLLGLKQVADRASADVLPEVQLVQEQTRAGLEEVRQVARRLRPGVLEDLGLHNALVALSNDFAPAGLRIRRTFTPGLPELDSDAELVVYRIAQEALTNVARHAQANSVELSLTRKGNDVVLSVKDNGRGLRGQPEGAGIGGMRERALIVGGDLELTSGPTGGTEVRLTLPTEGSR
ncbi:HAMP domain-containing sensor histidine kinase [Kribbella amoyensis]|uniref:HAMP domain-containing sensor histidine kinase n=1 Tax=Kribbella amoyensis TaxID=996641 RepID=UPI001EE2F48E|nr:HAMP domain-containing sensor histidine kinase [Kribbella amoyensis]